MLHLICIYFSKDVVVSIYDLLVTDPDNWVMYGKDAQHKSGVYIFDFLGINIMQPAEIKLNFFETILIRKGMEFLKFQKNQKAISEWNEKIDKQLEL